MVSYPIIWTKKAIKDLQQQFDFLCERYEREEARSIIQSVADKVAILTTQPKAGQGRILFAPSELFLPTSN
jgi:plasmid stabilization system protein ParE